MYKKGGQTPHPELSLQHIKVLLHNSTAPLIERPPIAHSGAAYDTCAIIVLRTPSFSTFCRPLSYKAAQLHDDTSATNDIATTSSFDFLFNFTSPTCASLSSWLPSSLALLSLCPILFPRATLDPAPKTTVVLAARYAQEALSVWGGQAWILPRGKDALAAVVRRLDLDLE